MDGATGRPIASASVRTRSLSFPKLAGVREWAPPVGPRYCVHGEGEAGGRLVGADAALAEDDVAVAVGEDVLGGEQPLLDRRPHATLQEHGLVRLAGLVQE